MPGSYRIDVPRGLVFSRGWGVLTDEFILAHAAALRADERFDPGFRQLVDLREVVGLQVAAEVVRDVGRNNPFRSDARRAFVVSSDEVFGMTRMFGHYANADTEQFGVFRALGPAMEWLGEDSDAKWPAEPPDATFGV